MSRKMAQNNKKDLLMLQYAPLLLSLKYFQKVSRVFNLSELKMLWDLTHPGIKQYLTQIFKI